MFRAYGTDAVQGLRGAHDRSEDMVLQPNFALGSTSPKLQAIKLKVFSPVVGAKLASTVLDLTLHKVTHKPQNLQL